MLTNKKDRQREEIRDTHWLGTVVDNKDPDNFGKCKVKVPQGVQSGKQLRLKGKGMPPIRGGGYGDLYIDLSVETPVNLNNEQKDLLRQFEKSGGDNHPAGKDFISTVKKFWDKGKK